MFKKKELIGLDLVLDLATTELLDHTPGSEEYNKILETVERINKVRNSQKSEPVNKGDFIPALTNILGIGLILQHERLHVITSKAVGFVKTLR
jgi:hypothetical protein